jgi:ribosomal protein S27AE
MSSCPKCGSGVLMDHLKVLTGGEHGALQVQAFGNPYALVFKEAATSSLEATVCGDCGYTELFALEPKLLVQAVRQAERRRNES